MRIRETQLLHTYASARSADEWEQRLGEQLRRSRLAAGLDQAGLAAHAGVSIGALRNLEHGRGSTLKTLVRVIRVLGRDDWLDALSPAVSVSPIDILRGGAAPRTRVYRPRLARPDTTEHP